MYYSDHRYLGSSVPELSICDLGNASAQRSDYFRNHYNFAGAYLYDKEGDDVRAKPAALALIPKASRLLWIFSTTITLKTY